MITGVSMVYGCMQCMDIDIICMYWEYKYKKNGVFQDNNNINSLILGR